MHRTLGLPAVLCSSIVVSPPTGAQERAPDKPVLSIEDRLSALEKKSAGDTVRSSWKDGLRFESADKRFRVKLGGRIHYDAQFFHTDSDTRAAVEAGTTRIEDGAEFRRARIEMSGEVGDRTDWALAVDFAGGSASFRNVYAGLKDLPFGNLRVGQFKEPYGLEQITSSNHLTFTERSLMNAFVPAFNAGIMLFDEFASERATWSVGVFRAAGDAGEVSRGDGEYAATARLTAVPLYSEDGKNYLHVGAGYSRRSPTNDSQTFSSRPEANLAPNFVAVTVPTETVQLIGLEAAWTRGPLTVSGEYTRASIDADSGSTSEPDFSGYYLQAACVLTGESRAYRKAAGCFDGIKPESNALGEAGGRGAWELAARVSSIDLEDDGSNGGTLDDATIGLNWYLNANTRLMLDYTRADLDPAGAGADGETSILGFRWQFAF